MLTVEEVHAVVAELAPLLRGGQVQKVREPDEGTVVLRVRRPGESRYLVLSVARGAERVAEAAASPPTLPEPTTLGAWLRSALQGRRLEDLVALPGDRVVVVQFEGGRLIAELTGASANLYGLDAEGRIMAVARRAPEGERDLRPGRLWRPPAPPPAGAPRPVRFAHARGVEDAAQARLAERGAGADEVARRRLVKQVADRLARLRRNVQADLARAEGAEQYKRWGELIKTQLWALKKGDTTARLTDWYAEGTPAVDVPLQPELDPQANAERYFARYRKARAGAERAAARLVEVDAELARLDAVAAAAESAEALEAALRAAGLLRARQTAGTKHEQPRRKPYREWLSRQGERILVGRGGADNHVTTFQIARGNDHWLHVRDAPGAHVIVPEPARGRDPHPETLLDAAALAVHGSDLRGERVVDVMCTRRKHVRAVKGAGPGRVTVAAAKSLTVADAEVRVAGLQRLE